MNFQKWNYYPLFAFLLVTHSQVVLASNTLGKNNQIPWVATASLGSSWENAGNTQTFFLTPGIEKTYTANHSTHLLVDAEFFLGIQQALRQNIQGQIGLEIARTGNAKLSGHIWDDADPTFNNYTYQYNIQHTHIALKGKLLGDWELPIQPWISAAIGVGFNKSYDFSNSPTIIEAIPSPNFASNTTTAFTYSIGIGIERELIKHWKTGLGYEFADWGKSQLGSAPEQTLNSGLSLAHLYTNSVLLNVTYQA